MSTGFEWNDAIQKMQEDEKRKEDASPSEAPGCTTDKLNEVASLVDKALDSIDNDGKMKVNGIRYISKWHVRQFFERINEILAG